MALAYSLPVTKPVAAAAQPAEPRRLDARELFGARNVVLIRHAEQDYVLRLTRNGKLILTK
jgi:hemin uptake protein HemP